MGLEVGSEIYVETALFSGDAIIKKLYPEEIFGVEIELNNPDEDGHRLKRVANYEVREKDVNSNRLLNNGEQAIGTSIVTKLHLTPGKEFILKPTHNNAGTHFYYYDVKTEEFLGCEPVESFKDLTLSVKEEQRDFINVEPEENVVELIFDKKGQGGFNLFSDEVL